MVKPLRKRHLQIWTLWALLLPTGIIISWLYIPNPQPIKLLARQTIDRLPVILQSKASNTYTINIRSNKDRSAWQLEWQNNQPLATPSAIVYKKLPGVTTVTGNEIVGRIEARGDYIFPLQPGSINAQEIDLVIYDFIHETIIDSLKFKL